VSRLVGTLVLIKWSSNMAFAITPLERLFYDTALELGGGDPRRVHFAYKDLKSGFPKALPSHFLNVHALDMNDRSPMAAEALASLIRLNRIELIVTFDVQPIHPAFGVARRAGVRTIVSYWGAPISSRMPRWILAIKRTRILRSACRLDGLVFESQAMADLAIYGRGVPPAMIDIVPLGVDIERFRPATSTYVSSVFDIPLTRRVIVYSGHCTPRKGIRTLIDAAMLLLLERRRDDVCFLLCGNQGTESEPYERLFRGTGAEPWIRFLGYRDDMIPILQSAYCGVVPSSGWDSFPRSAIEMSATGLPVIASSLQGLKEAVLDGRTGLHFEPGNARALADCLTNILDSPELALDLGRRGRERCETELNLAAQHRRFTLAIRRHLDASSPKSRS
jgi:glycosyltransferase involved in cell wall biosynthesis